MSSERPVCLFTYANNKQAYLHHLSEEQLRARERLERIHDRGIIEYVESFGVTLDEIFHLFNRFHGRTYLFHFAGHSDSESLKLADRDLWAENFATLLREEPQLKLAFLNGCDNFGHVQGLLDANVNAIIATTAKISDKRARDLSIQFYDSLASGRNLKGAFNVAASFVNNESNEEFVGIRGFNRHEKKKVDFPWGLYHKESADLSWTFQSSKDQPGIPSKTDKDSSKEHKDYIEELLKIGELGEAIGAFLEGAKASGQERLVGDLTLLSGRYHNNEKSMKRGVLTAGDYERNQNRLMWSLRSYLENYRPTLPYPGPPS